VSLQRVPVKSALMDLSSKEHPVVPTEGLVQDLRKALNNPDESDIIFTLEGDKKTYASKWLLSLRSEHFRALLKVGTALIC
jgi:hypothetical protein